MHWVYLLKCEKGRYYIGETKRLYRRFSEHKNPDIVSSNQCYDYEPIWIFGIYSVINNLIYKKYSKLLTTNNENSNECEICEHILPEWWFKCKGNYLCTSCDKDYYLTSFYKDRECNIKLINDLDDILEIFDDKYKCSKKDALSFEEDIALFKMKQLKDKWYKVRGSKYNKDFIKDNPSIDYKYTRPCCKCSTKIPAEIHIYDDKMYFRCFKKSKISKSFDMDEHGFENTLDIPYKDRPCNFYLEVDDKNNYYTGFNV